MIYLEHLLEATHGTLRYQGKQTHFDAFSHDSRQIVPGELFVAVRGERSDGHDYLMDAVHRGATGLLVEARVINALPEETLAADLSPAETITWAINDSKRRWPALRNRFFLG